MAEAHPSRVERRLAAIVAADVAGYSRLMGLDEVGTARTLREHRKVTDALVAKHGGRLVKSTGDGVLLEFPSVVDAVECAVAVQAVMAERNQGVPEDRRMLLRIGINLGDILIEEGGDILGDGVNVAARLEGIAEPGGICISASACEQVRGKVPVDFTDLGEQKLKNIDRPVRVYATKSSSHGGMDNPSRVLSSYPKARKPLPLPEKPSIVVLPFDNMSAEDGQGYLADGFVEAITAALSCIRSFFVIARSSAFTYKGRATDAREVGTELGVAYLLEGSVQKVGNRLRIIVQLIETEGGAHVWSSRYDGMLDEFFDLQDRITQQVAGALQPSIRLAEIERSRRRRPQDLSSYDYTIRAMLHAWALEKEESSKALELLEIALGIDPEYPLALALAGWCHAQRSVYNQTC